MTVEPAPRGWQAVYALVQDSEVRVSRQIGSVSDEVKGIKAALDTHLLGHAVNEAASVERVRLAAMAVAARANRLGRIRTFIATVLPIPAAILALLATIKVFA